MRRVRELHVAKAKASAVPAARASEPLRVTTFEAGPDTFAILSFPLDELPLPESLSAAEKAVCRLVLTGASNAEIARQRRTSVRTVANQVAAILKKLGAGSRSELPMVLARRGAIGAREP
jgi:DNA-binding NarL/FixJ family response regulator